MISAHGQPIRVRKRPVAVEAMYYDGFNRREIRNWMKEESAISSAKSNDLDDKFRIVTLEGTMTVKPGDWVIKGIKGEFYPCNPDIFEATYELIPRW